MDTIDKKFAQEMIVLALSQKWTNIGLSVASFFTAYFTYLLLDSSLQEWWISLSNSLFFTIILSILLFIPVAILLFFCLIAYEVFNSISFRIFLLIVFAFLLSVFNVFIVSSVSDMTELVSSHSIGIFLVYTFIILSALSIIDYFLMPGINIYQETWHYLGIKTLYSLPFLIIIWQVTNNAWIFLALLIIMDFYFFYHSKTALVWARIFESYIADFMFKGPKTKEFPYGQFINILSNENYKKLGLYFSLYNILTPLFLFLNSHVEQLDMVTEHLDQDPQKGIPNKLDVLYEEDVCNSNNLTYAEMISVQEPFKKSNVRLRIIKAILFYVSFCFILFYIIGNLFGD